MQEDRKDALGNYYECRAELDVARSMLRHEESRDTAVSMLRSLQERIEGATNPKTRALLKPVQVLLRQMCSRDGSPSVSRTDKTDTYHGVTHQSDLKSRGRAWIEPVVDSFLRQESIPFVDFLLVLSVLSFNVAIAFFLSGLHVEIKGYVEPVLRFTDIVLVAIFCAESLVLLVLTAGKEVFEKWRLFRESVESHAESAQDSPAAESPALSALRQANRDQIQFLQSEMDCGRFTKDAVEMPDAFACLSENHARFDAVSRDELPFWLSDPTNPFAEEYFLSGADLARKGKKVTRTFLLSRNQTDQIEILKQVLIKHLRARIGFAVVPFEMLPINLKKRAKELDFGLWDRDNAYSVFRQREGGYTRRMDIVLAAPGKNPDVARKLALYKQLMVHAWLVDAVYADCQSDLASELLPELSHNNDFIVRRTGIEIASGARYCIEVETEEELGPKVDAFLTFLKVLDADTRDARESRAGRKREPRSS